MPNYDEDLFRYSRSLPTALVAVASRTLMKEITFAIIQAFEAGIFINDIKTPNVLVDRLPSGLPARVKICDLGGVTECGAADPTLTTYPSFRRASGLDTSPLCEKDLVWGLAALALNIIDPKNAIVFTAIPRASFGGIMGTVFRSNQNIARITTRKVASAQINYVHKLRRQYNGCEHVFNAVEYAISTDTPELAQFAAALNANEDHQT